MERDAAVRRELPYPAGWYAVTESGALAALAMEIVHYFGQDIVLFRGASGGVSAFDPFCPHLGAHYGHGGRVEGDSLRCPFHGWRFDGSGACVEVPGCAKIPPGARAHAWPVHEQDGLVFVYYHPRREPPAWRLPPPLERRGWTEPHSIKWKLRTHPQEVNENAVDLAHHSPVHRGTGAHVVGRPVIEGPMMNVVVGFVSSGDVVDMPDIDNSVEIDTTMHGLGHMVVLTRVANLEIRARQRIYCTPIDARHMHMRGIVDAFHTSDAAFSDYLAEMFFKAFQIKFGHDFPIWENKAYVDRPLLSAADGPIGPFRRWAKQFYPDTEGDLAGAPRSAGADGPAPRRRLDVISLRLGAIPASLRALVDHAGTTLRELAGGHAPPLQEEAMKPIERGPAPRPPADGAGHGGLARMGSIDEYFATLDRRFVPAAAKGMRAVFQWNLSGVERGAYHAVVDDGAMRLHEGEHAEPTVTIVIPAADYLQMVNGEIDGMKVFISGRGKIRGSIPAAMKMRALFPQRNTHAR